MFIPVTACANWCGMSPCCVDCPYWLEKSPAPMSTPLAVSVANVLDMGFVLYISLICWTREEREVAGAYWSRYCCAVFWNVGSFVGFM